MPERYNLLCLSGFFYLGLRVVNKIKTYKIIVSKIESFTYFIQYTLQTPGHTDVILIDNDMHECYGEV